MEQFCFGRTKNKTRWRRSEYKKGNNFQHEKKRSKKKPDLNIGQVIFLFKKTRENSDLGNVNLFCMKQQTFVSYSRKCTC
jgi:hypothetical protein